MEESNDFLIWKSWGNKLWGEANQKFWKDLFVLIEKKAKEEKPAYFFNALYAEMLWYGWGCKVRRDEGGEIAKKAWIESKKTCWIAGFRYACGCINTNNRVGGTDSEIFLKIYPEIKKLCEEKPNPLPGIDMLEAHAHFCLGWILSYGPLGLVNNNNNNNNHFLARNYSVAIKEYICAAKALHPGGLNNYGVFLHDGRGVAKNEKLCYEVYSTAAEMGNPSSVGNVAICYHLGVGTKVNLLKATKLKYWAANHGVKREIDALELWILSPDAILKDWTPEIVSPCFEYMALQGSRPSFLALMTWCPLSLPPLWSRRRHHLACDGVKEVVFAFLCVFERTKLAFFPRDLYYYILEFLPIRFELECVRSMTLATQSENERHAQIALSVLQSRKSWTIELEETHEVWGTYTISDMLRDKLEPLHIQLKEKYPEEELPEIEIISVKKK